MAEADAGGHAGSGSGTAPTGRDGGGLGVVVGPDGDPDPLAVLAAGTFHVALLVVVAVVALQSVGNLGGALVGLGTLPGAAVYLVLWAVGWWTTRRAVGEVVGRRNVGGGGGVGGGDPEGGGDEGGAGGEGGASGGDGGESGGEGGKVRSNLLVAAVVAGARWGAAAAVAFFLAVGGVAALALVLDAPAEVGVLVLLVGIGAVVAAVVGSVVGVVLALLDVVLLGVAVRVVRAGSV